MYTDEDIKRWEKEAEEKYKLEDVQTEYLDGEKMSEQDRLSLLEYDRAMYVDGKIFENTDEEVWLEALHEEDNIENVWCNNDDKTNYNTNITLSEEERELIKKLVNEYKE